MNASENPPPESAEQPEPVVAPGEPDTAQAAASAESSPEPEPEPEPEPVPSPEPSGLDLDKLADLAERPDEGARIRMRERLAELAIPAAGLGRLEGPAVWLAGVRGHADLRPIERARVIVFAGDHGVATLRRAATGPDPAGERTA